MKKLFSALLISLIVFTLLVRQDCMLCHELNDQDAAQAIMESQHAHAKKKRLLITGAYRITYYQASCSGLPSSVGAVSGFCTSSSSSDSS